MLHPSATNSPSQFIQPYPPSTNTTEPTVSSPTTLPIQLSSQTISSLTSPTTPFTSNLPTGQPFAPYPVTASPTISFQTAPSLSNLPTGQPFAPYPVTASPTISSQTTPSLSNPPSVEPFAIYPVTASPTSASTSALVQTSFTPTSLPSASPLALVQPSIATEIAFTVQPSTSSTPSLTSVQTECSCSSGLVGLCANAGFFFLSCDEHHA